MTVNGKLHHEFRGISLKRLRHILSESLGGEIPSFGYLARSSQVNLNTPSVIGLIEEARTAGLLEFGEVEVCHPNHDNSFLTVSPTGLGIATLSGTTRQDKAKAQAHLDALLERCAANNNDPLSPIRVQEVWIYGSMIQDDRSDVGDIDIVVLSSSDTKLRGKTLEKYIDETYPGTLPSTRNMFFDPLEAFNQKAVFGTRKNPIFSKAGMQSLIDLHCPCAQVFDASRGGKVDAVVIPHHPLSEYRASTVRPRAIQPTFPIPLNDFKPTPISLTAGRYTNPWWEPHAFDLVDTTEATTRIDGRVLNSITLDDTTDCVVPVTKDGRKCLAAATLKRSLKVTEAGTDHELWTLTASIDIAGNTKSSSDAWITSVQELFRQTIGADLFRLLGRRHELAGTADILISVQPLRSNTSTKALVEAVSNGISRDFFHRHCTLDPHFKYGIELQGGKKVDEFYDNVHCMADNQHDDLGPNCNLDFNKIKASVRHLEYWEDVPEIAVQTGP